MRARSLGVIAAIILLLLLIPAAHAGNVAPAANAGPDQSVRVGALVRLDGSHSSDPDGPRALTYAWRMFGRPAGSTAALTGAGTARPSFVADVDGDYLIVLTVHDGLASSLSDMMRVTTRNSAPVANAGPDQTAFPGDTVFLDGSASTDVDGDFLYYHWSLVSRPPGSRAALSMPAAA